MTGRLISKTICFDVSCLKISACCFATHILLMDQGHFGLNDQVNLCIYISNGIAKYLQSIELFRLHKKLRYRFTLDLKILKKAFQLDLKFASVPKTHWLTKLTHVYNP